MPRAKRRELEIVQGDASFRDDKRVFCRFAVKDAPVRFKDLRVGEKGSAVCKDISGGGAGFECSQELKMRTPLELWFDLDDGYEPLHVLGKVSWLRQMEKHWHIGVAFDRPRLMSLSRILQTGTPQNL